MTHVPVPSKKDVLKRLIDHQVPITAIVDIGVRECTSELVQCFRDKTHHLFEPVNLFFESIQRNYRGVDYVLYPLAVGDENTSIYLILSSLEKNGAVTHSKISTEPVHVDGLEIVDCQPIDVRRFADLHLRIEKDFLLKVDVDGQDLNVVRGFDDKLGMASIIIIECTYSTATERIMFIQEKGFQLFDFVDFVYYGPGIYQFDAVFIRQDLITESLRPPISCFNRELWSPLQLS